MKYMKYMKFTGEVEIPSASKDSSFSFLGGEEMEIRFCVLSEPIPAARPRFSGRHAYQPKRNREYREVVQAAAVEAMNGREPMTGAVDVTIRLYRKFKPTARIFCDCDNHAKAILDALNKIVFADDAQVVRLVVEKMKSTQDARAEIMIEGDD